MSTKIKILKDTPFHMAGSILTQAQFRDIYPVFRSANLELNSRVFKDKTLSTHREEAYASRFDYHEYFEIVEDFDTNPLQFVHEDLFYTKEMDGMYHAWTSPSHYATRMSGGKTNSLFQITMGQAATLIKNSLFKKQILYCTDNVNKKL